MKLELKHLVGYLLHSVQFCSYTKNTTTHIYVLTSDIIARREKNRTLENIKPILRPLSDLTKEIEVNGAKILPILELAKITDCDTTRMVDVVQTNTDSAIRFDILNDDDDFAYEVFAYSSNVKMFGRHYRCISNDINNTSILFVSNQYELFEKLFEWHFDIHGLIPAGLAIDINTLNK